MAHQEGRPLAEITENGLIIGLLLGIAETMLEGEFRRYAFFKALMLREQELFR
jgi:hypothetical protein